MPMDTAPNLADGLIALSFFCRMVKQSAGVGRNIGLHSVSVSRASGEHGTDIREAVRCLKAYAHVGHSIGYAVDAGLRSQLCGGVILDFDMAQIETREWWSRGWPFALFEVGNVIA